ncbi:unnamed protein product [Rotaria magnacalcarata]|uniref:HAT C-terminal dimerisation domain-containing protein n=1 Tax=Rotaria magnacalcarata TaxID=392030 RepID=A0A816ZBE5_9BILA|nr:unnamed protein product [Rotaria magnacalcarata]
MKSTTLLSTEEIELAEVSSIFEDETSEPSSLIQNAPLVDLLNPSNINDLPENYDESEVFVSSKCDMHCCNSPKPYHPVTNDELALTTTDKRSCQKWWFMDHSWLTFCKVSNRKWFSLICDETCDESTLVQLCVSIRSVNDNYAIFEDVLGLCELSRQNAEAIVEAIFDTLTRCGLNISACRDLAVHDLTNECPTISNCILFAKDIIGFVRRSPKCLAVLKEISSQLSMPYSNLTSLCPTRWTMRAESYNSLLNNYELGIQNLNYVYLFILLLIFLAWFQEALYTLIEEKGGPGIKANSLHKQMNKIYFFFRLKLGYLLFSATEKLSRIIQNSGCCLQDVLSSAESLIRYFERIRDDINFKSFYTKLLKESESLTDKPILARHRRPPKRYQSNSDSVEFSSCEEFYRQQYMESLEIAVNMLQNRFTQKNFKLLCNVEKFILYAGKNSLDDSNDYFQSIMDFCYGDIDVEKLKVEALMIVDFFQSVIKTNQMNVKQITKISTNCEIFNSCEVGKEMFKEYHKLIKLYLIIPVRTATAERTFSTLNRLKTAIHSTMTQSRLNHCLLPHIYKEKIDKIDPRQIASKFISSNEKWQDFFCLIL